MPESRVRDGVGRRGIPRPPATRRLARAARLAVACLACLVVIPSAGAARAGTSLQDALRELEAEGLTLVFSSQVVKPGMRVEHEPTAGDPVTRLEQILAPHGLEARPLPGGGYAIVRATASAAPGSLTVRVLRGPQAAPIAGARVRIEPPGTELVTDRHGFARFTGLPPGAYDLHVDTNCCGVRELTAVSVPTADRLDVTMGDGIVAIEELVVHASRYSFSREGPASSTVLPRDIFQEVPGVAEDAVRVLQQLPGTASNGLSARTHVRGASEDALLVRFDGVRLYNPFHLKDFQSLFGILDPELLEGVEYFSGGFPARYGDRSAGVLDIEPRRSHDMETLVGVSFLNSRLVSSGTVFDGRGEWLAGVRRSNLSAVLRTIERDVGEPEFEDFILRYRHTFGDATRVTLGVLGLDDSLDLFSEDREQQANATYRDRYNWVRFEHDFGARLTARLTVTDATLTTARNGDVLREGTSNGQLEDRRHTDIDTVGLDFAYTARDWLQVSGGTEFSDASAAYDYRREITFEGILADAYDRQPLEVHDILSEPSGSVYAAWLAAKFEAGDWAAELGLRWDDASYVPDGSTLSPRLSLRRHLGAGSTLRLTFGRYVQSQSINELDVEEEVPRFAPPEDAWHAIASYERQLAAGPALRVEAFARRTDQPRPRYESELDPIVLLPDLEVDRVRVAPDRSHAQGVEVSLERRDATPFGWWASYTWSRVTDDFGSSTVAASWDQRQAVLAGVRWTRGRWGVSASVNWHSGWPYTPLEFGAPSANGVPASITRGLRNSRRYPDFFSLDLRADYVHPLPIGSLEAYVEVLNATNHVNPCCRVVEVAADDPTDFVYDRKGWMGIVPIAGVSWRF